METKICKKCGEEKILTEYYSHPMSKDKRDSACKECRKTAVRKNRKEKIDYYRNYDKRRSNRPDRVDARKKYAERMKRDKPELWREMRHKTCKKYRENNPLKDRAHRLVAYHVANGDMKKKDCEICGENKAEAHHEDYNYPLDVIWLCPKCHAKRHKEINS